MKLTLTIDTDRLAQYGGGDEPLIDFVNRVAHEARTGGKHVWTKTVANVGTIDRAQVHSS